MASNVSTSSGKASAIHSTEKYWATLQGDELVAVLNAQKKNFHTALPRMPQYARWLRGHTIAWGVATSENPWASSDVAASGLDGELVSVRDGTLANIFRHLVNMAIEQRPAFKTRPINSDYASEASNQFASGVLDYYMTHKGGEEAMVKGVEHMVGYGETWIGVEWDQSIGKPWMKGKNGQMINEGDMVLSAVPPMLVVRDLWRDTPDDTWILVGRQKPRWDLYTKYKNVKDAEDLLKIKDDTFLRYNTDFNRFGAWDLRQNSDLVTYWTFYHDRTPACPNGAYAMWCGTIMLESGPLPYDGIPFVRGAPSDIPTTASGDSPFFHVMGLQKLIDDAMSASVSAMEAFSIPNVIVEQGTTFDKSELGGMNYIELPPSPQGAARFIPQLLKFEYASQSNEKMIKLFQELAELNSGVNSVRRGDPEASLKSGVALALVDAKAVEFAAPVVFASKKLWEKVGNKMVKVLRQFAKAPKVATIAGKDRIEYRKEFDSSTFDNIDSVTVENVNPISKTLAGRQQLADTLLQNKLITNIEEYFAVLETGQVERLTKGQTAEIISIQKENENLRDGKPVAVVEFEDHVLHYAEHAADFFTLKVGLDMTKPKDAARAKAYADHMAKHLAAGQNPGYIAIAAALGHKTFPPPPPPPMPVAPAGAAPPPPNGVAPPGPQLKLPQPPAVPPRGLGAA